MRPILVLFTLSLSFPQCTGLHPSSGLLLRLTSKGSSSSLCSGPLCSLPLPDIMSEHVTVIHSHGGAELEAAITPGSRQGWAAVVCHPWGKLGGDMDNPVVITLKNALARRGFTVCRLLTPPSLSPLSSFSSSFNHFPTTPWTYHRHHRPPPLPSVFGDAG